MISGVWCFVNGLGLPLVTFTISRCGHMVKEGERVPSCVDGLSDGLSVVGYPSADEFDPLPLLLGIVGVGDFGIYLASPDYVEGLGVD